MRKGLLGSGFLLGFTQIYVFACSFVRNLIVVRLLSVGDYGIAATFALTISLLEMISNLSIDKLIIQDSEGDSPELQGTLQAIQVARGILLFLLLLALAGPFARLFGVPEATSSFRSLAFIPLIRGFFQQDIFRFQRSFRFGPSVVLDLASSTLITLAAYPLVALVRDSSAVVYLLLAQAALTTIGSLLLSEREFLIGWHPGQGWKAFHFGWPLLLNGFLMFVIMQGDSFLIGSSRTLLGEGGYPLEALAIFSLATSVALIPSMFVGNTFTSIFLPLFSGSRGDRNVFSGEYAMVNQVGAYLGMVTTVVFINLGLFLIGLLYGPKYASAYPVMVWLGIAQSLRILRVTPTIASIAWGDTRNSLISNLFRSSSFLITSVVILLGWDLVMVAVTGVVGEVLAYLATLSRLRKNQGISPEPSIRPALWFGALTLATLALSWTFHLPERPWVSAGVAFVEIVLFSALLLTLFREMRESILQSVRKRVAA